MADEPDNSAEFVEIHTTAPPEPDPNATPPEEESTGDADTPEPEGEAAEPDPDAEGEGDAPLRDDKGRYKGGVQGRIDELTRARRQAERERDAALAQLRAPDPAQAAPTSKPTADQFDDYGDYVEALTDWKVADRERTTAGTRAETAEKAVNEHRAAEWSARVGAAKPSMPDFDAVMEKADTPTASHVASAIMEADRGPELLYHLASNPAIVEQLNTMSPARAAIELGRIEATLEAPAAPPKPRETKQSKAPAPITPVAPGSTTTKDPAKMDMDEYKAYRAKQGIR